MDAGVSREMITQVTIVREELPELRLQVRKVLAGLAGGAGGKVELIFNEAVNNALRSSDQVRVRMCRIGQRLVLRVKDYGTGFAGNEAVRRLGAQSLCEQFEDRLTAEHGRGLLIMKALSERICYNRQGTEIMLVIRIGYNIEK